MIVFSFTAFSLQVNAEKIYVDDTAGLLSKKELSALTERIKIINDKYNVDTVIVTQKNIGNKTTVAFADDYFDYKGYGRGKSRDGVLFLLNMSERDWYISTSGSCIKAFSDNKIQSIGKSMIPFFSKANYYDAFAKFLDNVEETLGKSNSSNVNSEAVKQNAEAVVAAASVSESYEESWFDNISYFIDDSLYVIEDMWDDEPYFVLFAVIIFPLIVSSIATYMMWRSLNTVRKKHSARGYVKQNSFDLTYMKEMFLYSTVTRTERPKDKDDDSGGSSTHTSSSGESHGGGGGKF